MSTRLRFPHPLVLLVAGALLAALLSHLLPAGEFDRRDDPATGRRVVVAGSYHRVPPQPVGAFQAVIALPKGMADAASVVFFVFLVGGAFTVVDRTGALRHAVDSLVRRLHGHGALVIPVVCTAFAAAGALENMQEEIIALVPLLLLLTRRLGDDALVAVAASLGAAAVGAAFSPINPFQVGIAQKLAELPLLSASLYRLAFLVPALLLWIWAVMRYSRRTRVAPVDSSGTEVDAPPSRRGPVLALVIVAFALFVYGVLVLGWDFDQMSALFFVMGVAAGLLGGLGLAGTAEAFVEGFREMAFSALLIGFARAIFVVLDQGKIIDTIVNGLSLPLGRLPVVLSAFGMVIVHAAVHVPVPSVSGQAVLTLPVLVPLSDLIHLPRQVTVLAYQYGAGLCELLTPTNGALMAMLAAAGVRYDRWLRFVVPVYLGLLAIGLVSIAVGIAIGLR